MRGSTCIPYDADGTTIAKRTKAPSDYQPPASWKDYADAGILTSSLAPITLKLEEHDIQATCALIDTTPIEIEGKAFEDLGRVNQLRSQWGTRVGDNPMSGTWWRFQECVRLFRRAF